MEDEDLISNADSESIKVDTHVRTRFANLEKNDDVDDSDKLSSSEGDADVQPAATTKKKESTSRRATKRILAPFVKIIRKSRRPIEQEEEENKQFEFYLKKRPSVLMRDLSTFLDNADMMTILFESAEVLKHALRATGVTVYVVDEAAGEICQCPRHVLSERHRVTWKIQQRKTIAAYVAATKDYIIADEILGDLRFLDGAGYQDETIKSVLCLPIVDPENVCRLIIELYRDVSQPNFSDEDLKTAMLVTSWAGTAVTQNEKRVALQKQQELNDYLLDLILCYFAQTASIEKLISEVVIFAKSTLGTERGSFYIVYQENDVLEAEAFEEGIDGEGKLHKKNMKVKLKANSILGTVAQTLEVVNIRDAYADPRYDTEADDRLGLISRSLLCVPITSVKGILGLIQLVNKKNSVRFSSMDEDLLKTFSLYCALALHYYHLSQSSFKMNKLSECYTGLFKLHAEPCCHDLQYYTENVTVELPEQFDEFTWYITSDLHSSMPQFIMSMMLKIIGTEDIEATAMMKFILSVRKLHLENPYHSFEHAFMVCHCMYNVLLRNREKFTILEIQCFMIAALCHDLDHRGFSNNFLFITNNILTQLYEGSYLENYHYQLTMILLQDTTIFNTMSCCMFKEMTYELRELILATDLAAHLQYRAKLTQILEETEFDWEDSGHRRLLKNVVITMCDLSGICRPYQYVKKTTESLYKEFYQEGDFGKDIGLHPLPLMDRDKSHMVPEDQVQFINVVLIPCAEVVQSILPNTECLLLEARKTKEIWCEIIELRGEQCWRPQESFVHE